MSRYWYTVSENNPYIYICLLINLFGDNHFWNPVASLSSNGLRMCACVCLCITLAQYGMNSQLCGYANIVHTSSSFHTHTHTHTHTFSYHLRTAKPTGLKVDIAICLLITNSFAVDMNLLFHCCCVL